MYKIWRGFVKILLGFVLFVCRPIWNMFVNIPYVVYYGFKYLFVKSAKDKYIANKAKYDACKTLEEYVIEFKANYKYAWDGWYGILDHDNTEVEYFQHYGDCDDMALYTAKKMQSLGIETERIFLWGKGIVATHFDCFMKIGDKCYLFNYGSLVEGNDLDDCVKKLGESWDLFKECIYIRYFH